MYRKAFSDLLRGLSLWRVWGYQAWHEMTARYKRTVLGPFWLAGQMVITAACLALIWGGLMGRDMRDLFPYILSGMLCFPIISYPLASGSELYVGASNMIRNHAFPFTYFSMEQLCSQYMTFAHNAVIYWIIVAAMQESVFPHWSFLLAVPIVTITSLTWGSVIGMMAARFRDLRFMLPFVSQLMFYVTPIMWRVGDISTKRAWIAQFNPFYGLLEIMRAPFLGHPAPAICWQLALGTMAAGCIVWLIAFPVFRKRIPFWV